MNKDIGFIIVNTENSYFNIISKLFDKLQTFNKLNQYAVFCSTLKLRTNRIGIPFLPLVEAQFFQGNLLVFDIQSFLYIKNFPNINKIYYYMDKISWDGLQMNPYRELKNVFDTPNLEIIASDDIIYYLCYNCWKKPLCIAKDLDYDSIKNFL